MALRTIDVKGKGVMVPNLTCTSVRDAIILAGATPIFVDIDPASLDIILTDAHLKLTDKTTAIILIHYYGGFCTNIAELQAFARQHNLTVIEDCAHSLGAEYKGKKLGNFGNLSIFSLTKNTLNLSGGLLCTNHKQFYDKARIILLEDNYFIGR